MGEIADSLISGEFDYITGEYLGEAIGFPRTRSYGKRNAPPIIKKPSSKANVCISNMCKDRGFSNHEKVELVAKFLHSKGHKQLPNLSQQYKIIHSQYKNDFRKFLIEQVKQRNNGRTF
ncbi:hypothetical protein [Parabacteroides sp. AM08-6]|uniref:hypothetical protein n=1 Tax=Parabacteroides sp. AM08-6 TaxID=2292053 RepID=UPI000F001B03|nr:hypothetical protein [Parabacteroides sp. AM08-6]RHJ76896.1 hypothetical protein DW103_16465 [Parabacteroides sp. AM08-6]